LTGLVSSLREGCSGERPTAMKEFPPFRLDPANQCLWRLSASGEDERILLTPTEFGVLDHLVERAGQLVTHRDLLDAVWPRTVIEPQAVKSKVFHLRRVLDDDPRQPRFIETVSRRGYRFVGKLASPVVDDAPASVQEACLVGRDRALAELSQCMRSASAGKPQVVFVTGEAGLGKTALADEFQRQVSAQVPAMRIAHGQCMEGLGTKEPFYPALQAVGQLCRNAGGATVIDTLASHAPTWLVQFPALLTREHRETLKQEILGATRERMLREICEAIETIAESQPLLLILEDLHWADSSTLDLVSALARHPRRVRLMVIATYRSTDAARSAQPLHALKRELVARHLCREVALEPLGEAEIASYLAHGQAAADVPEELAALLHRHTEGNPLFMIAVLEHLMRSGLVERDRGGWRLTRSIAEISLEVPESLRQMIGAQIDRLGEWDQHVLEVAAIAGMSFTPVISAPAAEMDAGAFEVCCDALARCGHILRVASTQELPDGRIIQRYSFVHALYREVLYERQAPARRAMLHRRRAERLEEVFADALDEVAAEIAQHFETGADWARAVKYLRRAADVAGRRFSHEGARANLQHALALAGRLSASERAAVEIELLHSLAGLYLATLDARVVDTLTTLREKAAERGLVDVEVQALVDLAYPLAWSSSERSIEVIDRALRLSDTLPDPLGRARTRARCMVRRIMVRGWDADDAEESQRALAEVRRLGSKEDVAWHLIDGGFVELNSSHYRQARRDAVDSVTLLRGLHDENIPLGYIAAHRLREYIVPWSLTLLGEWGAARREFDASIALADRNADLFGSGVLRLVRCWLQLFAMDFAGARSVCDSIQAAPQPPGRMFGSHLCLTLSGAAEAGLGNHEGALERLLAARGEMDRHVALLDWYSRFWQRWALTNLWLSTGDVARAREEADLFVANACATAERTWQALAWDVHARIALASGDLRGGQDSIGRALEAIESFEAPVAAWQAHATAADIARARGDEPTATHHLEESRGTLIGLAASLEPDENLRRTFLAAPAVARVLREE
jgi:DNA-binding winged helix-turn-helix (wHTH) protein/tetratricopeptide (TPR) repeat protein